VLDVVRLVSMVTGEVAFAAFARLHNDRIAIGELLVKFNAAETWSRSRRSSS